MTREIERLMKLRELTHDEEKVFVNDAINMLNESFKRLLQDSREYLLTGEKGKFGRYDDICTILQKLRNISEKFQDEELVFPVLQNEKEARVYLAKYGKEVILNK